MGRVLEPGYEHVRLRAVVERMEPQRLFSWRWHPAAIDPQVDYSSEPMTLVVFELEPRPEGTLLKVTESGFDQLPPERRAYALRMNEGGWEEQARRIARHVAAAA